jgi:RNA polymerase sigma-70 factor (ECF subfamily)
MCAEPTQTPPCHPLQGSPGEDFRTTRWTQVRRAKADSPEGRRALAELCNAYYEPVVAFLRCELRDADAARELAHDFFAHMLAGGAIARVEQERGRFRSFLLGAVKHFLSHQREALRRLKRGGGVENLSLNEARAVPDAGVLSPDAAFDQQWALTVVAHALEALRHECVTEGRGDFFELVKPWLTGDTARGEQAALAASHGMNANALKVAVHRLKQRFRQLLKAEVAGTLDDPGKVEAEMRALFAALGG